MIVHTSGVIAIAARNQTVAAFVLDSDGFVVVRRFVLRPIDQERVAKQIGQLKTNYCVTHVVVEGDSPLTQALERAGLQPEVFTLAEAKQQLLGVAIAKHGTLYDHLVDQHPELARFVRLQPGHRLVATTDWHRTVVLLAAALGLAFQEQENIP